MPQVEKLLTRWNEYKFVADDSSTCCLPEKLVNPVVEEMKDYDPASFNPITKKDCPNNFLGTNLIRYKCCKDDLFAIAHEY